MVAHKAWLQLADSLDCLAAVRGELVPPFAGAVRRAMALQQLAPVCVVLASTTAIDDAERVAAIEAGEVLIGDNPV